MNWDLSKFYQSFEDPKYFEDVNKLRELVKEYNTLIELANNNDELTVVLKYVELNQEILKKAYNLYGFNSLTNATDVTNEQALINMAELNNILEGQTKVNVFFVRFLENVDLNKYLDNPIIKDNLFILEEIKNSAKYLLSEGEELLYTKLAELGSSSWGFLQSLATSKLDVKYNDETLTLSQVRNLAHDSDSNVRKAAYHAELAAYEGVAETVALALSNIKREVVVMNEFRGYNDALEKTLISSRMQKETLDAMIEAMLDSRDDFERYLQAKAKYLGHDGGLPFYDLFAPVGSLKKTYSYEEAQATIIASFSSYSDKLANFAKKAFANNWIDPFPKKGKVGGAFCSNQPQLGESRILSNFTGSLSDVQTLAHELGHGYHGEIIKDNSPLNWDYPMPLAETASIFCETIVTNHLLSEITDESERLSILEISLQGDTQVIIDILSRFIFENNLFKIANRPVSKDEMKSLMLEAQKTAYQKGLDENNLHPYMWLNKGHYYSSGLNFYNFPYAFGLLFGKGLYAQYLENPKSFLNSYDNLLALTTSATIEDVAKSMNIDVTKKAFWESSLNLIKKDINEVIELMKK